MALFYASDITDTTKTYTLSEEESKDCIRVLPKKKDEEIELVNGKGGQFFALICDAHEKRCKVEITRTIFHSPSKAIHIGLAPTKNMDRIEWFVEKATELGLTKLSFLSCTNNERTAVKLERVNKIAIGAMKQSKRFYLPEICELISFNLFCRPIPPCQLLKLNDNVWFKSITNNFCRTTCYNRISRNVFIHYTIGRNYRSIFNSNST